MLCFSIVLSLRRLAKAAPKSGNFNHACAQELFGSQNRQKTGMFGALLEEDLAKIWPGLHAWVIRRSKLLKKALISDHFWKSSFAIFAPRLRENNLEVKIEKNQGLKTFLGVECLFCVAGKRNSTICKIRGRPRSLWGLQKRWQAWWIWRGSKTMRFAWHALGFCGLWCRMTPKKRKPFNLLNNKFCHSKKMLLWRRLVSAALLLLLRGCCNICKGSDIPFGVFWFPLLCRCFCVVGVRFGESAGSLMHNLASFDFRRSAAFVWQAWT